MGREYNNDIESMWDDFEVSQEFLEDKPGQIYIRRKIERFLMKHRGGGTRRFDVGFFSERDMHKKTPLGWIPVPVEFFNAKSLREPNHPMRFLLTIKQDLVFWGHKIVCYMPTNIREEKVLKPKAELRKRREAGQSGEARSIAEAAGNPVHQSELTTKTERVPLRKEASA